MVKEIYVCALYLDCIEELYQNSCVKGLVRNLWMVFVSFLFLRHITIKVYGFTFREGNSVLIFFQTSEKGSTLKGNNLVCLGADSFLLE